MSTATSYSKLGYLMLKKESSAGVAVYPDEPIEILSKEIVPNWDFTPANTIAGNRSNNNRPVLNKVGPFTGSIEILVEPNTIGHFLCGLYGEDTHTVVTAGVVEISDFQPQNTLQTYTMDVKTAGEDYVTRYFGVRIQSIQFSLDENKLKATINVMAQRIFQNARVTAAVSSGTALAVDQTSGLTTSDTLQVLDADNASTLLDTLTVAAVGSELGLTTSTITGSLSVGDIVVIKARTLTDADYDLSGELIWSGGAEVYIANGANSMQNLSAKTNCETFELTSENELEARHAATGNDVVDRMPSAILLKGLTTTGKFSQFHTNPEFLDMLRQNEQVGLRFKFIGRQLASNSAVAASATIETDGSDTLAVTVDAAGEAGNDYAIKIVQGTTTLSAALSGKLITVTLDADAADNTTSLVAAAIHALSGVACTSTGTDLVTVTDNPNKIQFSGGRDANERELLQFDIPNARLMPFDTVLGTDDIVNEEIEFTAYRDSNDQREVKARLRNDITAY